MDQTDRATNWSLIITPKKGLLDLHLRDLWSYRDLIWMFIHRDFVSVYKQTILGPIWFLVQPALTTLTFTVVFSGLARISTDGYPPILFYLSGITPWNYFSACLTKTSNTFVANAAMFGKVYFPRLIVPISIVLSNMIQFGIQLGLFLSVLVFYLFQDIKLNPNWALIVVLSPALLLLLAAQGLGTGIIVSSLTTKYRDLNFLISFGVQLLMYGTPIIYPLNAIPEKWRWLAQLNPITAPVESFRAIFFGSPVPWTALAWSTVITTLLLFLGIVIFNKIEQSFIDTV